MRGQSWMLYQCKDAVWTVVNNDGECGHLSRHWKTTLSADPIDTLWCQVASENSVTDCSDFWTARLICCVEGWMILSWLLCMQASLCQSQNCVHCGWEVVSGCLRWIVRNCCFLNLCLLALQWAEDISGLALKGDIRKNIGYGWICSCGIGGDRWIG